MSADPALIPETTPDELTVATEVLDEVQVPPVSPLDEIAVVLPAQIEFVPLRVPAFAPAEMVILNVAELLVVHGEMALTV